MEEKIDVGKEFHSRLIIRNEFQGRGEYTAINFREKYLSELDNENAWKNNNYRVVLDFSNVKSLSPGFANEAFGYFAKYAKTKEEILERIVLENITKVKKDTILEEIDSALQ